MAEQTLGEALQEVHSLVNEALGVQDGSVTFRTATITESTTFGLPDTTVVNSDVVISTGLKISWVKAREASSSAKIQEGDLKIQVPGSLITKAQIENAEVIYNEQVYTIQDFGPMEIYSGIQVRWQVFARVKA